jgi:mannose-1-phosphate guanylyltransferase
MARFSAFVLAAGYGTRLRPLTDEIPKPLLPVGGEPLLLRTLRVLHEAGASELWINVHHMRDQFHSALQYLPFEVHVLHESRILGTAGGLAAVRGQARLPLIVVNGDIVTELPIGPVLERAGPGLTLAVTAPRGGAGTVGLGEGGQVVRLRGEVFGQERAGADYMGVACVGAECLATLPAEGCLIGDWALPWLRRGGSIETVHSLTPFRDLGDKASYLEVNLEWLGGASHVGTGARVPAEVALERSLVGPGARLLGAGLVQECVVLPGATATAPLCRTIVLPSGRHVDVP